MYCRSLAVRSAKHSVIALRGPRPCLLLLMIVAAHRDLRSWTVSTRGEGWFFGWRPFAASSSGPLCNIMMMCNLPHLVSSEGLWKSTYTPVLICDKLEVLGRRQKGASPYTYVRTRWLWLEPCTCWINLSRLKNAWGSASSQFQTDSAGQLRATHLRCFLWTLTLASEAQRGIGGFRGYFEAAYNGSQKTFTRQKCCKFSLQLLHFSSLLDTFR